MNAEGGGGGGAVHSSHEALVSLAFEVIRTSRPDVGTEVQTRGNFKVSSRSYNLLSVR